MFSMLTKKNIKKAVALSITLLLLYLIYSRIDLQVFYRNIININVFYLFWALSLFPVISIIKAYRWRFILGDGISASYFTVLKVLMAGSVFNLFAPSKLGDFSRVYFCRKELSNDTHRIFNSVVVEKICDVFALCLICLVSLNFVNVNYSIKISILIFSLILFFTILIIISVDFHRFEFLNRIFENIKLIEIFDDARKLKKELKNNKNFFSKIFIISILYWYIVLFQVHMFFLMFNLKASFVLVVSLVPMALFIGMIPITLSGIGTRDVALIFLFSGYFSSEIMAAIGILCSSRYLVTCLIGLPFFLNHYFTENQIEPPVGKTSRTLQT
jgi:hypothetical protein|tara:strand:+ start:552 stop:1538 length:987 start_codon:yes stop_codon:yes gene_type:complete